MSPSELQNEVDAKSKLAAKSNLAAEAKHAAEAKRAAAEAKRSADEAKRDRLVTKRAADKAIALYAEARPPPPVAPDPRASWGEPVALFPLSGAEGTRRIRLEAQLQAGDDTRCFTRRAARTGMLLRNSLGTPAPSYCGHAIAQ